MEIQQYIYARLTAEQSPRNTAGFQSAFVPADFLSEAEIRTLESRIHYPAHVAFTEKTLVFPQMVAQQPYLALFFLQALPDERDAFGRGGAFICQGFFLPPELWQQQNNLLAWEAALQAHRFADTAALLNADGVDRASGSIAPINFAAPDRFPEAPKADEKLVAALQALLLPAHARINLVLKGGAAEVSAALGAASAELSARQRLAVGWDPAFDGGRMHASPFRIFGYSRMQPTMGRMVELDLATGDWRDAPSDFF